MNKFLAIAVLLLAPLAAGAQTSQAVQPQVFTLSGQAMGYAAGGESYPATDAFASLRVTPKVSLSVDNYLIPAISTDEHFGNFDFTLPLPQSVSAKQWQVIVGAGAGIIHTQLSQVIAEQASVLLNYDPTASGKFTINIFKLSGVFTGRRVATSPTAGIHNGVLFGSGIQLSF